MGSREGACFSSNISAISKAKAKTEKTRIRPWTQPPEHGSKRLKQSGTNSRRHTEAQTGIVILSPPIMKTQKTFKTGTPGFKKKNETRD